MLRQVWHRFLHRYRDVMSVMRIWICACATFVMALGAAVFGHIILSLAFTVATVTLLMSTRVVDLAD